MRGRISFIGAGPGAADLITVRAARRIAEADVVVWSASVLAPDCVREHARADAELVDSSQLTHEQALELYRRAERDKLRVVRLHAGDPAMWGAVQDQHDACGRMELQVEIVPGVAGFSAAAAAAGRELTAAESAQSVVVARMGGGVAESEQLREFARHGTTLAVTLPAARADQLVEELRAGGCADEVPVLVAYKVSWPDELLLRTTVGELEHAVKQRRLWRNALFLVGKAVEARSRGFHGESGYRRADAPVRRPGYRPGRRRGAGGAPAESEPDDLPQQRANRSSSAVFSGSGSGDGGAVPNIAWWAVREWQQEARGAARVAARTRRPEDPAQSELFDSAESEADPMSAPVEPERPESEPAAVESAVPEEAASEETASAPARPSLSLVRSEAESEVPPQPEESEPEGTPDGRSAPDETAADTPAGESAAKRSEAGTSSSRTTAKSTRAKPKAQSTKAQSTKAQSKTKSTANKSRTTGAKSPKPNNDAAD